MKDTFDAVPISVATYLKSESESVECCLEVLYAVDEKHGVVDSVFLAQFLQEPFGQYGCCSRVQPQMKDIVRLWIDGGVQPELLVIDPNHRFVDCDLIRSFAIDWLWIGFLHPIVDRFPRALDTQTIKNRDGIRE